ncbi:hypothetical protein ACQ4K0_28435 [Burkholderia cepacia]|uniref:hypothetical protein n=1 Tax=Burkholderia cepacia TaxID=292 RepID=UPI003D36ADBD
MTKNRVWTTVLTLSLTVLMSGCGNVVPTIPEMVARSKWEGKPMSQAYQKWGQPAGYALAKDGEKVAYWNTASLGTVRRAAGQTMEQTAGGLAITDHWVDETITYECTLVLKFNQNNVITQFKTLQNRLGGCTNFYWGGNGP